MKVRLGRVFIAESDYLCTGKDERAVLIATIKARGQKNKTGITVDVSSTELEALINECDYYVSHNSPEGDPQTKEYINLRNQLKSLKKIQETNSLKA